MTDRKNKDLILYRKYVLTRNVKGYNYPYFMKKEDAMKLEMLILQAFKETNFKFRYFSPFMENKNREFFKLRSIISENDGNLRSGILLFDKEEFFVKINAKDHISFVLYSCDNIDESLKFIYDIEKSLSEKLDFQFDENYGYLGADPSNIGSGLYIENYINIYDEKEEKDLMEIYDAKECRFGKLRLKGLFLIKKPLGRLIKRDEVSAVSAEELEGLLNREDDIRTKIKKQAENSVKNKIDEIFKDIDEEEGICEEEYFYRLRLLDIFIPLKKRERKMLFEAYMNGCDEALAFRNDDGVETDNFDVLRKKKITELKKGIGI